jgi:hypothetical protein
MLEDTADCTHENTDKERYSQKRHNEPVRITNIGTRGRLRLGCSSQGILIVRTHCAMVGTHNRTIGPVLYALKLYIYP